MKGGAETPLRALFITSILVLGAFIAAGTAPAGHDGGDTPSIAGGGLHPDPDTAGGPGGTDGGGGDAAPRGPASGRALAKGDWPQHKRDATGTSASDTLVPTYGAVLWETRLDNGILASPVIKGDTLYTNDESGNLYAIYTENGTVRWQRSMGFQCANTPAVSGDRIYVAVEAAPNSTLFCLNTADGSTEWQFRANNYFGYSSPTVSQGTVYIGGFTYNETDYHDNFFALDAATGDVRWKYHMGHNSTLGVGSSPAVTSGSTSMIYQGTDVDQHGSNGSFYGFDPAGMTDGNQGVTWESNTTNGYADVIWTYEGAAVFSSPLVVGTSVYFGDNEGKVHALDTLTGAHRWSYTTGGAVKSSPAVDQSQGLLYVGSDDNRLYAIYLSNGSLCWSYETGAKIGFSAPSVSSGRVFVGSFDQHLWCFRSTSSSLSSDQRLVWKASLGHGAVISNPALSDGRAFVTCREGWVVAVGTPELAFTGQPVLSDTDPFEGELVHAQATVANNGSVNTTATVTFTIRDAFYTDESRLIIGEEVLDIPRGETRNAHASWRCFRRPPGLNNTPPNSVLLVKVVSDLPEDDPEATGGNYLLSSINPKEVDTGGWRGYQGGWERQGSASNASLTNRPLWTHETGGYGAGPLLTLGRVISTSSEGVIESLDPTDEGEVIWTIDTGHGVTSTPMILYNKLFVAGDDGVVRCYDAVLGDTTPLWTANVGSPAAGDMLVANGTAVLITADGYMHGIDEDNGTIVWSRFALTSTDDGFTLSAGLGQVAVSGPSTDLELYDIFNGRPLWTYDGASGHSGAVFVPSDDQLIVGRDDGRLICLDATPDDNRDGYINLSDRDDGFVADPFASGHTYDVIWQANMSSSPVTGAAVREEGNQVAAISGSLLGVYNLTDGDSDWTYTIAGDALSGAPAFGDEDVLAFTGSGGVIRAGVPQNASGSGAGELVWEYTTNDTLVQQMAVGKGQTVLVTEEGTLISLGADNLMPHAIIDSPGDGDVFFTDEEIELDAASSFDPDDAKLTYTWISSLEPAIIHSGYEPTVTLPADAFTIEGEHVITLTVTDSLGAQDAASVNITVLTERLGYYPNRNLDSYGYILFGGNGVLDMGEPDLADDGLFDRSVSVVNFTFLKQSPSYRIKWTNISMGYDDEDLLEGLNSSRIKPFSLQDGAWEELPSWSAVLERKWEGEIYERLYSFNITHIESDANYTQDLILKKSPRTFALGTFDDGAPELSNAEANPAAGTDIDNYEFTVWYRDPEGFSPTLANGGLIEVLIDGVNSYPMNPRYGTNGSGEGDFTAPRQYIISGIQLDAGSHTYAFVASDGTYTVTLGSDGTTYGNGTDTPFTGPEVAVGDMAPVLDLSYLNGLSVEVRTPVQFTGFTAYDPDDDLDGDGVIGAGETDNLIYSWDFGDGTTSNEREPYHTYSTEATMTVSLTVSDGRTNATDSFTLVVTAQTDGGEKPDSSSTIVQGIDDPILYAMIILFIGIIIIFIFSRVMMDRQKAGRMWTATNPPMPRAVVRKERKLKGEKPKGRWKGPKDDGRGLKGDDKAALKGEEEKKLLPPARVGAGKGAGEEGGEDTSEEVATEKAVEEEKDAKPGDDDGGAEDEGADGPVDLEDRGGADKDGKGAGAAVGSGKGESPRKPPPPPKKKVKARVTAKRSAK